MTWPSEVLRHKTMIKAAHRGMPLTLHTYDPPSPPCKTQTPARGEKNAHRAPQVVWPSEPSRQESSTATRMHALGSAFLVKPAQMARSTSV